MRLAAVTFEIEVEHTVWLMGEKGVESGRALAEDSMQGDEVDGSTGREAARRAS